MSNPPETRQKLRRMVGDEIIEFRRILYEYQGTVSRPDLGQVEFVLCDSGCWLLEDVQGGMVLRIRNAEWENPFGPGGPERDYRERFGAPKRFDVSDEPPYSSVVGRPLEQATPVFREERLGAVVFQTESQLFSVCAAADECWLKWSDIRSELSKYKLDRIGETVQSDDQDP